MPSYVLRRLLHLIPVLFAVTLISFLLMYLSPGDPVTALLEAGGSVPDPAVVAQKRHELGLDQPVYVQYLQWVGGLFQGNLGTSIGSGRPVVTELLARMPATLFLAVVSMALALAVSVPLGCLCAQHRDSAFDRIVQLLTFAGAAVPGFLMALLLVFIFALCLHWLPSIGSLRGAGWVLPVLTLVLCESAVLIRQVRTLVLQELGQDYVRAARLRGISRHAVLVRSVLKAVAPTIVVLAAMSFAQLLGGSAIIETIFNWPGIGAYAVQAVFTRDYPVVQGYVLLMAIFFVVVNLAADVVQTRLDPRALAGLGLERTDGAWRRRRSADTREVSA